MTTYKLFEHSTTTAPEESTSKYYVRIESNFPSMIPFAHLKGIVLTETLGTTIPRLHLEFTDMAGSLVNTEYISPEQPYSVYFGKSHNTASTPNQFQMADSAARSNLAGSLAQVGHVMEFYGLNWIEMLAKNKSRSWGSALLSDVVQDVVSEISPTSTDVETTDVPMNVIQPNWNNQRMLRWLATYAHSQSGNIGYDFVVRTNGSFAFKSYNAFFANAPVRTMYVRGRQATDINMYNVSLYNPYALAMGPGAGLGAHYIYYDWQNRRFVTGDHNISQTNQSQLSDWYFLASTQLGGNKMIYGAQDINTKNVAEHVFTNSANSAFKMSFQILGDNELQTGNIINLVMNTNELLNNQINEMYSGYWMISGLNHVIDFQSSSYNTIVTVIRAGLNGKQITNLAKSQVGKVLVPMQTA